MEIGSVDAGAADGLDVFIALHTTRVVALGPRPTPTKPGAATFVVALEALPEALPVSHEAGDRDDKQHRANHQARDPDNGKQRRQSCKR